MQKLRDKLLGEFKKEVTPKELKKYNDDRLSWAKETDDKLLKYIDNVAKDDPATMKMISEYNPNEVKYNSALGQFEKDGKRGALSDFVKPTVNFGLDKPQIFNEKAPMQNALKNVQRKGMRAKKMNDIDILFSAADPKEKMGMRKRYKDYDFTQRKFKEDIKKVEPQITSPAPIAPNPVPQKSVGEIIRERAAAREVIEKKEYVKKYGNLGLGGLGFREKFGE